MFKKLLSNLPFNPSLIHQVTFYAKRLHKEASIRRLGLFFVILSLLVQIFAVIAPAQPSLAEAGNDIIPSGFRTQGDAVNHCNNNDYNFKDILARFDIDCEALFFGSVRRMDYSEYSGQLYSLGYSPENFHNNIPVYVNGVGTLYMRPMTNWGAHCYQDGANCMAIVGTRANGTPFMVLFACGNVVIVGPPTVEQPQPKAISCANLIISVPPGSKVPINTTVLVKGQAYGTNLPEGERVHMFYDYINADTGAVLGRDEANGILFGSSGTSSATDDQNRPFTVTAPGHYVFRLAIKYNDNGNSADAAGNLTGACARDVFVDTPPPKLEKVIECSSLISSFSSTQPVVTGTDVTVRGQASGRNLADDQRVNMHYDYINTAGKVLGSSEGSNIGFKDGLADDATPHSFKLEKAGTYTFRLAVTYDGGTNATGNRTGNCVKVVHVVLPCDASKNNDVIECVVLHKKASNLTQHIDDANGTRAHAGDVILYTLSATNTSTNTTVKDFVFNENITDILEYATVLDYGGGIKNTHNNILWPATDIKPGETVKKQFKIRIKNPIPKTPASTTDPKSFDMQLTNVYGDTVTIKLPPSVTKTTEHINHQLPNTGPGQTLAIGFTLAVVVGYFFARSRLMAKELDVVRLEYTTSGGY